MSLVALHSPPVQAQSPFAGSASRFSSVAQQGDNTVVAWSLTNPTMSEFNSASLSVQAISRIHALQTRNGRTDQIQ